MNAVRKFPLGLGEAAPWFTAPVLDGREAYVFDSAAGRPILLLFFGTAANPLTQAALAALQERRALFDDANAAFFGITIDPSDVAEQRIRRQLPGIRFFLDYDGKVSRLFGAAEANAAGAYRAHWLVLDRALRVRGGFSVSESAAALDAYAAPVAAPPVPGRAPGG